MGNTNKQQFEDCIEYIEAFSRRDFERELIETVNFVNGEDGEIIDIKYQIDFEDWIYSAVIHCRYFRSASDDS